MLIESNSNTLVELEFRYVIGRIWIIRILFGFEYKGIRTEFVRLTGLLCQICSKKGHSLIICYNRINLSHSPTDLSGSKTPSTIFVSLGQLGNIMSMWYLWATSHVTNSGENLQHSHVILVVRVLWLKGNSITTSHSGNLSCQGPSGIPSTQKSFNDCILRLSNGSGKSETHSQMLQQFFRYMFPSLIKKMFHINYYL